MLAQFSSRGPVKIYDLSPAMRGIGYGQVIAMAYGTSYYSAILGLALKYLYESSVNLIMNTDLPWTICKEEWKNQCISKDFNRTDNSTKLLSSAELYFE